MKAVGYAIVFLAAVLLMCATMYEEIHTGHDLTWSYVVSGAIASYSLIGFMHTVNERR